MPFTLISCLAYSLSNTTLGVVSDDTTPIELEIEVVQEKPQGYVEWSIHGV